MNFIFQNLKLVLNDVLLLKKLLDLVRLPLLILTTFLFFIPINFAVSANIKGYSVVLQNSLDLGYCLQGVEEVYQNDQQNCADQVCGAENERVRQAFIVSCNEQKSVASTESSAGSAAECSNIADGSSRPQGCPATEPVADLPLARPFGTVVANPDKDEANQKIREEQERAKAKADEEERAALAEGKSAEEAKDEAEKARICSEQKALIYDRKLSEQYKDTTDYAVNANANYDACVEYSSPAKFPWQSKLALELENDRKYQKEQLERKYAPAFEKCEKEHNIAIECCGSPEKCFTNPDGIADEDSNSSQYADIAKMLAATALNFPTNSITSMCKKMKTISLTTAGINTYLGLRCSHYVNQCKNTCNKTIKEIQANSICANGGCEDLLAKFDGNTYDCKVADNASLNMHKQAVAAETASKMADLCEKQATADNNSSTAGTDPFANANCTTPSAASNPICQAQCSRPGAAQNPNCLGYPGLAPPGGGGGGFDDTAGSGPGNPFAHLVDEVEGEQNVVPMDVAAIQGRSSGGGGGGGGSAGLPGGGGDGGGAEGAQGPGGGGGYDTGILKGTMSGGGYSPSGYMRTGGGGGFSGYGGSNAITAKARPFNLKDYLPGSGKTKKLAVRGIASVPDGISPAHTDIFKKVTDRFYQVCLRNALYDCASLRKIKRSGQN